MQCMQYLCLNKRDLKAYLEGTDTHLTYFPPPRLNLFIEADRDKLLDLLWMQSKWND